MFNRCDFLLGQDSMVIIVIPAHLPKAETYTVSVTDKEIRFRAGYDHVAEIAYQGGEVYQRIAQNIQVGIVEYTPGGELPACITNVAYVEVRRAAA